MSVSPNSIAAHSRDASILSHDVLIPAHTRSYLCIPAHTCCTCSAHKVGTPEYNVEYDFVKKYGALDAPARSAYETDTPKFWLAPAGKRDGGGV